jgi:hypothetical protein
MVKVTKNRSYTVHARSLDRQNPDDTSSNFSLTLNDPIETATSAQYLKASLLNANVPSSFYQIDAKNQVFKVGFNRPTFSVLKPYLDMTVAFPTGGRVTRRDYEQEVTVKISKGNYDIESLLAEVKVKLNDACTAAHALSKIYTFARTDDPDDGYDPDSALAREDLYDSRQQVIGTGHVITCPQFDWEYSKALNKMRLFRTDTGGLLVSGKFDVQTQGRKLSFCLGFNHVTAQMLRQLNVSSNVLTTIENSLHYRETTDTEHNDFVIKRLMPNSAATDYGHSVYSASTINMFHNDAVYMRSNLPPNGMETLSGGSTNVLCIIPMTSGSGSENFYIPTSPTTTTIDGAGSISQLAFRFTDGQGQLIDFEGGELSFSILFECFDKNTYSDKPADAGFSQYNASNKFSNVHQNGGSRHSGRVF